MPILTGNTLNFPERIVEFPIHSILVMVVMLICFFSHLLLEFSMRLGHLSYFSIDMGWSMLVNYFLHAVVYESIRRRLEFLFQAGEAWKKWIHQQHKRASQAFDFPLDNYWLNHETAEKDEATRKGSLACLNKSEKQKSKRQKSKWISWA